MNGVFAAPPQHSWQSGAGWIFATCAYFLNGWQAAIHAVEERRAGINGRTLIRCVIGALREGQGGQAKKHGAARRRETATPNNAELLNPLHCCS